jgi:hypothetical protein
LQALLFAPRVSATSRLPLATGAASLRRRFLIR